MKYHVLIYEGYVSFEIMLATYLLKTKGDIVTVGITKDPVRSSDDFTILPDIDIYELNIEDVHLLLIPGGDPEPLRNQIKTSNLVKELISNDRIVAGICSAGVWVKELHQQIQKAKDIVPVTPIVRYEVEVSGNVVTAPPHKYIDFAIELGAIMNIYPDDADQQETVEFFKNFRSSRF